LLEQLKKEKARFLGLALFI